MRSAARALGAEHRICHYVGNRREASTPVMYGQLKRGRNLILHPVDVAVHSAPTAVFSPSNAIRCCPLLLAARPLIPALWRLLALADRQLTTAPMLSALCPSSRETRPPWITRSARPYVFQPPPDSRLPTPDFPMHILGVLLAAQIRTLSGALTQISFCCRTPCQSLHNS